MGTRVGDRDTGRSSMKYALVTVLRLGGMLLVLLFIKDIVFPSDGDTSTMRLDYLLYLLVYSFAVARLYRWFPNLLPPGMTVDDVMMSHRERRGASVGGGVGPNGDGGGDGGDGGDGGGGA